MAADFSWIHKSSEFSQGADLQSECLLVSNKRFRYISTSKYLEFLLSAVQTWKVNYDPHLYGTMFLWIRVLKLSMLVKHHTADVVTSSCAVNLPVTPPMISLSHVNSVQLKLWCWTIILYLFQIFRGKHREILLIYVMSFSVLYIIHPGR